MTWFKVDDGLWGHPKWLEASASARALWITAGAWCAQQETDGAIPTGALRFFASAGETQKDLEKTAAELVQLRLWKKVKTGWRFHDWDAYQPSAEQINARRKADKERKAAARAAKAAEKQAEKSAPDTPECPQDVRADTDRTNDGTGTDETRSPLYPTRPDQLIKTHLGGETYVGTGVTHVTPTPMPEIFELNDERWAIAERCAPKLGKAIISSSFEAFKAHARSKAKLSADWDAAWAEWVLRDAKWAQERANGAEGDLEGILAEMDALAARLDAQVPVVQTNPMAGLPSLVPVAGGDPR